ncbi:class I SAM-dependent methyltransferase [Kineococcus sp. NPDC059986]|uniref:class I SAM-dependent methyltransferase n=1 Tax=Kineococcus sp. NPDC059986 TaxID=3155538 RepID=UPI00344C92CB
MVEPGPVDRYAGQADWYDARLDETPDRDEVLRRYLPAGRGPCLDVGCGTGRDLVVLAEKGWDPVGVELSSDQVRRARRWGLPLVQGDAECLPFHGAAFDLVVSRWTSTDVEHFDVALAEVARVLRPAGRFLFHGVHPCFNGPHVENHPGGEVTVHPTYRRAERHTSAPWWAPGGIRTRVGGMRHVPLAEFVGAFVAAGLAITAVHEPGTEPVPQSIVVEAVRAVG